MANSTVNPIIEMFGERNPDAVAEAVETACSRCTQAIWTIEQGKSIKDQTGKQELYCFCDRIKKVTWGAGADGRIVRFIAECSAMDSGAAPAVPDLVAAGTVADGGMPAFRQ